MNYLLDDWAIIKESFFGKKLFIFLDYDGTLTPIVETPEAAELSSETRKLLNGLCSCPLVQLSVISGRALDDVRKRVGIKEVLYIGNHGFQIKGPNLQFESMIFPAYKKTLAEIKTKTEDFLKPYPGAFIEDKGQTVSVHFRKVAQDKEQDFYNGFVALIKPYLSGEEIRFIQGKKVFEIRPNIEWDKGKAASWVLKQYEHQTGDEDYRVIYVGDDTTDEDAFRDLEAKALTIRVGFSTESVARYYLKEQDEMNLFMRELLSIAMEGSK